ncbi:MAG: MBL fold metallo-hydrolase [Balneolaceae bacterium]
MKIGRFEIEHLSEGIFETFDDNTFRKVHSDSITKSSLASPELKQFTPTVGIDPILIRDGKHNILIDTGLGWGLDYKSTYKETSNLKTNLDIFGLVPHDITHVVLTHLHFDHAAGSTYIDSELHTQPTMTYANYFVQKKEWAYALSKMQNDDSLSNHNYDLNELYKLAAVQKLVFITDMVFELIPGIQLIRTGGHTPGHQIVKIQDAGETAYFMGDLISSETHLNQYSSQQIDTHPLEAIKARTLLLRQAHQEKAVLLFYHSIHTKAGRLLKDVDRKYVLEDV